MQQRDEFQRLAREQQDRCHRALQERDDTRKTNKTSVVDYERRQDESNFKIAQLTQALELSKLKQSTIEKLLNKYSARLKKIQKSKFFSALKFNETKTCNQC